MTRKLANQIKKRLTLMGLDAQLWKCQFMFRMDGAYYFKVIYDGNTAHGDYLVWTCYFSGDHFVCEGRQSQKVEVD